MAEDMGAGVIWTRAGRACFWPGDDEHAPAIFVPISVGPLEKIWLLCHELGHLVLHDGYAGPLQWNRQESMAERWAACTMIPEQRIRAHDNASLDALIAALSAHYEDIPLIDCPARYLAAKIARIRLAHFMEVSAHAS
jgi:Zn-dependent peptidase ImmA (M78 family)